MINYITLVLTYISLILTIYVDVSKIKRKTSNKTRQTQCIAISSIMMSILLFLLIAIKDRTIMFLYGKNYLLIALCLFAIILKKIAKSSQK